jgi:hypothetical protein
MMPFFINFGLFRLVPAATLASQEPVKRRTRPWIVNPVVQARGMKHNTSYTTRAIHTPLTADRTQWNTYGLRRLVMSCGAWDIFEYYCVVVTRCFS